jgi:hypothetical protein
VDNELILDAADAEVPGLHDLAHRRWRPGSRSTG